MDGCYRCGEGRERERETAIGFPDSSKPKVKINLREPDRPAASPISRSPSAYVAPAPTRETLKFGDIVYLIGHVELEADPSGSGFVGTEPTGSNADICVQAEGIADTVVHAVPLIERGRNNWMTFKLFRVEKCLYELAGEGEFTKEVSKDYLNRNKGSDVQYGDFIQLCHLHSHRYMSFSTSPGHTAGSHKIVVGARTGSSTIIQVRGEGKQGQAVFLQDPVELVARCEFLDYYLSAKKSKQDPGKCDLQASLQKFHWQFFEFCEYSPKKNEILLNTPFILTQKSLGLDLTCLDATVSWRDDIQSPLRHGVQRHYGDQEAPELTLANNLFDHQCYWVLEAEDEFVGGPVEFGQMYYLKHLHTNKFLGKGLELQAETEQRFALRLLQGSEDKLYSGAEVQIVSEQGEMISAGNDKLRQEKLSFIPTPAKLRKDKRKIDVTLAFGDTEKTVFEVHLIKDLATFVMWTNGMLPSFRLYYSCLESLPSASSVFEHHSQAYQSLCHQTETLQNALKALAELIDDCSESRERVRKKQYLAVGFKLHVIVTDIAKSLIQRLKSALEPGERLIGCWEKAVANRKSHFDVLAVQIRKLFPAMLSLLNTIAKDNKWTCKSISLLDTQIGELFPFEKKLVASLLSEVYRMINPSRPEEYYKRLCGQLSAITSENIEEQTLYLSLIRQLSEDKGEILKTSANVLAQRYVTSDFPHFFYRLILKNETPFVEFPLGEMTTEEFAAANPQIMKDADRVNGKPCFSLVAISQVPAYVEYVSEAALFMDTLCRSEYQSVVENYRSNYGFDVWTLLRIMKDNRIHLSFRASVLTLVDTLVLEKHQKVPFTTRQSNLSFRLEELAGRLELEEQQFTHGKRAEVSDIVEWFLSFWTRKDTGNDLFEYGTVPLLKFMFAVLSVTYTMINYRYSTPNFVRAVNPAILDLLISLLSTQREFHADTHWIQQLSDVLEKDSTGDDFTLSYNLKAVQDLTIRLIKLNLDMNLRAKLEHILCLYYRHREQPPASESPLELSEEIRGVVLGTAKSLDLSTKMILLFRTNTVKKQQEQQGVLDILLREPHIKEFLCSAILADMQLDSSTRQELMRLLYQILESNNALMRMLKSVDLIEEAEIIEKRKFLSQFTKEFNVANNEKVVREKVVRSSDGEERLRLSALLEQLLCEFSYKSIKPSLIKKMQNLARSYKIHYEMISLWKVLSPISESVSDLLGLIGSVLMNFCYGNELNRDELLKLIDASYFALTVPQLPYLIQEICNFEHLPHSEAEIGLSFILEQTVQRTEFLPGLEWVRTLISYRNHEGYKRDMQTLACFRIIEYINKLNISLVTEARDVGELVLLLADCAHGNAITSCHCKEVAGLQTIEEAIRKAKSPLTVRAWVCYLYDVYVSDSLSLSEQELCEVLQSVAPWFDEFIKQFARLESAARAGCVQQVWDTRRPYRRIPASEAKQWEYEVELWEMMSYGEQWQRNTGLLSILPLVVTALPSPSTALQRMYGLIDEKTAVIYRTMFEMGRKLQGFEAEQFMKCLSGFSTVLGRVIMNQERAVLRLTTNALEETPTKNHRKTVSDASTVNLTTSEGSTPQKENSQRSNEEDSHFQAFVALAVEVIEGYSKDYHETFKEMALTTYPMILFQQKHLSGGKRKELIKMLKLLNQKIGPDLKFMIYDLLDSIIRETANKHSISLIFIDSGLVDGAVSAIVEQPNFRLMKSAITFLNGLFEKQSAEFLNWFLEKIRASGAYLRLFSQLKAELNCSLDRILMRGSNPKQEKHLTAYERDIFSGLLQSGSPLADVFELADDYSINLVRFMQLCCDNCNLLFQEFMHTQTNPRCISRGSVNVVDTIANYVIVISQYEQLFTSDAEAKSTMIVCLEALLDFVTGPCTLNQDKLGKDVQFLMAVNKVLKVSSAHKDDPDWVLMYGKTLDFLMTLFEGSPSREVLDSLMQYLDISFLLNDAMQIYQVYIHGKVKELLLESPTVAPVAFVGFKIAVVASFFRYYFPKHSELAGFSAGNIRERPGRSFDPRKFGVINDVPTECIAFFYSFIGYVEIARNDRIESHFFQIPFVCKFLTEETKEDIIINVDRSSQQEKVESFLDMVHSSHIEMRHQQNLYRVKGLKYLSEGWQLYGWISFILVIVINLMVLADTDKGEIADGEAREWKGLDRATGAINVFQIIMKTMSYAFFLIEYYPNIVAGELRNHKSLEFPDYSSIRHNESLLMTAWSKDSKGQQKHIVMSPFRKLFLIAKNQQNLYFFIYVGVSMCCFWWRFLLCFLLLDIFQRSPELGNILKAITLNKRQLILIAIFWILVLYVFAGVALFQFSEYFVGDSSSMYCSDLWECFVSTLHMGVRYGGGIGEAMNFVQHSDSRYYARVVFDLFFFAVVILIIQNIIFGIIIDTFGELRDKRQMMLEDINQKCFICGSARSEIERSGSGWSHHFLNEHSPFAYLAFIKYLESKEMNECNGLEKFVKEKLVEKDSSFFPTSSRLIMDQGDREKKIRLRLVRRL